MLLRIGVESDAEAVLALVKESLASDPFMVTEADEFQMTVEQERAWIRAYADHPNDLLLIAALEERLVGLLNFHCARQRRLAHSGELGIIVGAGYRGRGIGRMLLTALDKWARAHPTIEHVSLKVLAGNEQALGLYRSCGFAEEGRRRREVKYADGRYSDAVLMGRWVKHSPKAN